MEIEIGDVEGAELGTSSGEDTVEHEFDEFKRGGFGAYVTWVADAVARYCDSGAVGIVLFRPDLANYIAVADFFETIRRYVCEVNDMEGVGSIYRRSGGVFAFEALT